MLVGRCEPPREPYPVRIPVGLPPWSRDSVANDIARNRQGSSLTEKLPATDQETYECAKVLDLPSTIVLSGLQFGVIFGDYVTARKC